MLLTGNRQSQVIKPTFPADILKWALVQFRVWVERNAQGDVQAATSLMKSSIVFQI
jgi:hypothetical protein